jgi:hypothetical protein
VASHLRIAAVRCHRPAHVRIYKGENGAGKPPKLRTESTETGSRRPARRNRGCPRRAGLLSVLGVLAESGSLNSQSIGVGLSVYSSAMSDSGTSEQSNDDDNVDEWSPDELDPEDVYLEDLLGVDSPENPVQIGFYFIRQLLHADGSDDMLRKIVTPESLDQWDFPRLRAYIMSIPEFGVGTFADRAAGAPDVAYLKLIIDHRAQLKPGSTGELRIRNDAPVLVDHIVTLVWRPERGLWLVHAFGEDFVLPELIPRTSPDEAPSVDRLAISKEVDDLST